MFSCTFCSKTFKSRRNLNGHILSHIKEKPYKCLVCAAAFVSEGNLKKHVKSVHDGIKEIKKRTTQCPLCSYKCYSKIYLERHLRKHTTEQPFCCSVPSCGFKTKYKESIQQHFRSIHSAERPFECPSDGCSFKTKVKRCLERHIKRHSSLKAFTCKVLGCNYSSSLWGNLKSHKCTSEEKPWKGSFCDFRSKTKCHLVHHEDTHKKVKRFQCHAVNCGFASSLKNTVDLHFDAKHRKNDVRCTEPGCNYRCGSIALLNKHLKRQELPILKCPGDNCNFRTKCKRSLLRHISRRRHEYLESASVVRPSQFDPEIARTTDELDTLHCRFPNCPYQTKFPLNYDRHMATHNEKEKRNHVCKFCFSRFSHLCLLESHVQRHVGEKPYRCAHCDFDAVDGSSLRHHAQRVHQIYVIPRWEEHQYERKCQTCNLTFSSYSEFMLHSMTHLKPVVVLERLRVHVM